MHYSVGAGGGHVHMRGKGDLSFIVWQRFSYPCYPCQAKRLKHSGHFACKGASVGLDDALCSSCGTRRALNLYTVLAVNRPASFALKRFKVLYFGPVLKKKCMLLFLYRKKKICSTLLCNSPAKANVPLFLQQATRTKLCSLYEVLTP